MNSGDASGTGAYEYPVEPIGLLDDRKARGEEAAKPLLHALEMWALAWNPTAMRRLASNPDIVTIFAMNSFQGL